MDKLKKITHLEVEVRRVVLVGLANEGIQVDLEVGNRRKRWSIALVPDVTRVLGHADVKEITKQTHIKKHTEGQPVSAMYIVGLLLTAAAAATLVSSKNSHVQPAAWSIETLANHGWTLAICTTQR